MHRHCSAGFVEYPEYTAFRPSDAHEVTAVIVLLPYWTGVVVGEGDAVMELVIATHVKD